jgi:hypothetical protein
MHEIAFDESGNSGQNLLDPAQPIYTLASVARLEAEVAAPVAALLGGSSFSELKFAEMRVREDGLRILTEVFESGLLDPQSARVVPVEKDWMVAGKMVDLLWAPGAANSNYFYASGMHRQLASVLQRQGPEEAGADNWRRWQRSFVAAVRRPQDEARIPELEGALFAVKAEAAEKPVGILFQAVPDDAASLTALIPDGRDELDPALGGLVEQLHHWSQRLGEPFRVVHDDSAVVHRWRELLLRFSDQDMEPGSFDIGEIHFEFPLYGVDIETVDSRKSAAVQLADVLSGAVMWCLRERMRGAQVPPQWSEWNLGGFIDFFQGPSDILLGLVSPEGKVSDSTGPSEGPDALQI